MSIVDTAAVFTTLTGEGHSADDVAAVIASFFDADGRTPAEWERAGWLPEDVDVLRRQLADTDANACRFELDGTDTDGTDWYRCTTHDKLVMGDDFPCEPGNYLG